ncbi:MAG: phosphotyrosine protein phosphatase [Lachnospiraceae bacterium]|nr:phosphotyrosine protein phosphatase [Lachnospiraceae bacterium]
MKVNRIIFLDKRGNTRSAMARALYEKMFPDSGIEVMARGLVVSFSEPLNQKTEAVMAGNGLETDGFRSEELSDKDITDETLILTMNAKQRSDVISEFEVANDDNTFVLSEFAGEELEIMDPYGGNLQVYGICLEALGQTIEKLPDRIKEFENE